MRLTIRLFAGLRERAGSESLELDDLPSGLNMGRLKEILAQRHPELGDLEAVRGVVGTVYTRDEVMLAEGDEVSLLPPVSGGSGAGEDELFERGAFETRTEPLDPMEAHRRVAHPSCGAIVLFTGTTRATNRGQEVVELDYEAFQAMAGEEMGRIYAECRERFGPGSGWGGLADQELLLRMLTLHRTGRVGVGEPSVVIAVASPHRDAAFQAGRFLIDELKKRVPLWKKEVYSDGHHWIGDRS